MGKGSEMALGKKAILSLRRHGGGDLVSLGHLNTFPG